MGTYDAQAAMALRLITKKGARAVITRPAVTGVFDPVTETTTGGGAPLQGSFMMVELSPGKSSEYRIGSLAGRTVSEFYIAQSGAPFVVDKGDTVAWAGKNFRIIWTDTTDPAGDGPVLTVAYGEI